LGPSCSTEGKVRRGRRSRLPPAWQVSSIVFEKVSFDILAKPEMKKKLVDAGFDVTAKDAKGHAARIAKEVPMFKKVIADAGIKKL
jgi:hypothetical protein